MECQMCRRTSIVFACLSLALAGSGCGSSPASSNASAPTPTPPTSHYTATLSSLLAAGLTGTVRMALSGAEMDVTISLAGLTPHQPHMKHIHGAHGTLATCPTPASAN